MPDDVKTSEPTKPRHVATYAQDKRTGGYNIRIVGEYPEKFAGREVPVTRKDGSKNTEKLTRLLWSGPDKDPETKKETGRQAALYSFQARPREEQQEMPF